MSIPDQADGRTYSRAAVIGGFLAAGGIGYGLARPVSGQSGQGPAIVGGRIEAVSSDAVTISTAAGLVRIIGRDATPQSLASRTRQHRLEPGAEIVAVGAAGSEGTFVATEIAPLFREVSGRVDDVTGASIVIDGASLDITAETTFEPRHDEAQVGASGTRPAALAVGNSVAALVIRQAGSDQLQAARIYV